MTGVPTHYNNNHVIIISMLKPENIVDKDWLFCSEHVSCVKTSAKINSKLCLDTLRFFFNSNFKMEKVHVEVYISKSVFQHPKCQSVSIWFHPSELSHKN
jgi:hypothetical protein